LSEAFGSVGVTHVDLSGPLVFPPPFIVPLAVPEPAARVSVATDSMV
jgi:hypothetical protein